MGIVGSCTVSNSGLGSIIVLEEFGLEECWICRGYSESNSEGLLTEQGLGEGYIGEECDVRGLPGLESG
jgi:hypothetical protein